MPDQLTLFTLDPPPPPAAPRQRPPASPGGPPHPPRAPERAQAPPTPVAPSRAEREAAALAALEAERARVAELCATAPAPPPPAELVSALVALGVEYLGSYLWPVGGRVVGEDWQPSEELVPHHAVEGRFRPARGRMVLTKTDGGLVALRDALDLPDDLLAAGMHRHEPPISHYITLPGRDLGDVGISFSFGTLELNIAAAREYLEYRARIAASEAERAAGKAKKTRKRA